MVQKDATSLGTTTPTLPTDLIVQVPSGVPAKEMSYQEAIREALREYIRKGHGPERPIDKPEVRKALKGLRTLKWTDRFDSTAAVRQMRDRRHP